MSDSKGKEAREKSVATRKVYADSSAEHARALTGDADVLLAFSLFRSYREVRGREKTLFKNTEWEPALNAFMAAKAALDKRRQGALFILIGNWNRGHGLELNTTDRPSKGLLPREFVEYGGD